MRSLKSPKGKPEANERMATQVSRLRSGATTAPGWKLCCASTGTRASEESSDDPRDQRDQWGDDQQIGRMGRLPRWAGGCGGPGRGRWWRLSDGCRHRDLLVGDVL